MNDYKGRCGSCEKYMFLTKDGKLLKRGKCSVTNKYKQACDKACSKHYEPTVDIDDSTESCQDNNVECSGHCYSCPYR